MTNTTDCKSPVVYEAEITHLKADLEAAKTENAVLNRMVEATRKWINTIINLDTCNHTKEFKRVNCRFYQTCGDCYMTNFRAEAEKGSK